MTHYQGFLKKGFFPDFAAAAELVLNHSAASFAPDHVRDSLLGDWYRVARCFINREKGKIDEEWGYPTPIDTVQHVFDIKEKNGSYFTPLPSERYIQRMLGVYHRVNDEGNPQWVFLCSRKDKNTGGKTVFAEHFIYEGNQDRLVCVIHGTDGKDDLREDFGQVTVWRRGVAPLAQAL